MRASSIAVSRERIQQVLALRDHVLRNHWITQTYWELASGFAPYFKRNATWLSFAVWASQSAGSLIPADGALNLAFRADEPEEIRMVSRLKRLLDAIGIGVWIDRVTRTISDQTADGNRLVFAELAPILLDLQQALVEKSDTASLVESSSPGLRKALRCYVAAASEQNPKRRAELILLANLGAVLHEQQRLDSRIRGALDAVVLKGLLPLLGSDLLDRLPPPLARLARIPADWIRPLLTAIVRRIETDAFLTLRIWNDERRLVKDITPVDGKPFFPRDLEEIEDPELSQFLAEWDQTRGTGDGSGAESWAELRDRMNYICTLFRTAQQEPALFQPPFSPEQLEQLELALERTRARVPR